MGSKTKTTGQGSKYIRILFEFHLVNPKGSQITYAFPNCFLLQIASENTDLEIHRFHIRKIYVGHE